MKTLSVTDLSIALAWKTGKLRFEPFQTRFGTTATVISDDHGTIEVHDTEAEAKQRVSDILVQAEL